MHHCHLVDEKLHYNRTAHSLPYEPARILLPLWSHSIHGLQFYCAHTVQSDVSFMLGCGHKNLLTFTFGCCAGEINVKHTHTHKVVLFMYEMKNWIQMALGMSLFIKYERYILKICIEASRLYQRIWWQHVSWKCVGINVKVEYILFSFSKSFNSEGQLYKVREIIYLWFATLINGFKCILMSLV